MPEYLAPGVYVEEVSFRSKSIEGVPTSTTGFAGLAHYGPVRYPGGPKNPEPRLITSFTEFERVYGSLNEMEIGSGRPAYLAHAARAFFDNGGKRLYVSRVYRPRDGDVESALARRDGKCPCPNGSRPFACHGFRRGQSAARERRRGDRSACARHDAAGGECSDHTREPAHRADRSGRQSNF